MVITILVQRKGVDRMETRIKLQTPQDVQEFVNAAAKVECDVNLKGGVVFIDGKSFLGVMTMGLMRELVVHTNEVDKNFNKSIKKFAVA